MKRRYIIRNGELYHGKEWEDHKYIKREWKNGRWVYTYNVQQAKQIASSKDKRQLRKETRSLRRSIIGTVAKSVAKKVAYNATGGKRKDDVNMNRQVLNRSKQDLDKANRALSANSNTRVTKSNAAARKQQERKALLEADKAQRRYDDAKTFVQKSTERYKNTPMGRVEELGKKTKKLAAKTMSRIDPKAKERIANATSKAKERTNEAVSKAKERVSEATSKAKENLNKIRARKRRR